MNQDLYNLLGVPSDATQAQIKAAYRHKVKTAHPDAGGDPDEFVLITSAYNVLEDPDTRKAYDLSGEWGGENPIFAQARVVDHIASMFEEIYVQTDGQIADFDVISAMKQHISQLSAKFVPEERDLAKRLEALHKINREIQKRGESENQFSRHIEKRILELSDAYKAVKMSMRDVRRVREELDRSGSIVSIIRTIQSGAYAGEGKGSFWQFMSGNLTTT